MSRYKRNIFFMLLVGIFCYMPSFSSAPKGPTKITPSSQLWTDVKGGFNVLGTKAWGYMPEVFKRHFGTALLISKYTFLATSVSMAYDYHTYYMYLAPMIKKYDEKIQDQSGPTRFYHWEIVDFPTAHKMRESRINVMQRLRTQIENAKNNNISTLRTFNKARRPVKPSMRLIHKIIVDEIKQLKQDKEYLEEYFVVYFKWLKDYAPEWCGGSQGIIKDYYTMCKKYTMYPNAHSIWNEQTFININGAMEKLCKNRWWHNLLKINYADSAKLWWNIMKKLRRLEWFIKEIELELAGLAIVPHQQQNVNHFFPDGLLSVIPGGALIDNNQ